MVIPRCSIVGSDVVSLDEVLGSNVESWIEIISMDTQTPPGQVRVSRIEHLGVSEDAVSWIGHLGACAETSLAAVEGGTVGIGTSDSESRAGAG